MYISNLGDTAAISFKSEIRERNEHDEIVSVYEDIIVEQPIAEHIKRLCWELFVTEGIPIYTHFEYDSEQPIVEVDPGPDRLTITKNTNLGNETNEIDVWPSSTLSKEIYYTGDGYAYLYSTQFKTLMQFLYHILMRHYGGQYYDDYLRELNECRRDSTKEVFIPDSIK